jgi:hypothetical protein
VAATSAGVEAVVDSTTSTWYWDLLAWAFSSWAMGICSTAVIIVALVVWIALGCPGLWILFMLGGGGDSGSSSGGGDFGGGGASDGF